MAGELTSTNLRVAGFLVLFLCPMMGTQCVTSTVPGALEATSGLVCPEGAHIVSETHWSSDSRGPYSRVEARCETSTGATVGDHTYAKALGVFYVPLLVAWATGLFMVFRPRPETPPTA